MLVSRKKFVAVVPAVVLALLLIVSGCVSVDVDTTPSTQSGDWQLTNLGRSREGDVVTLEFNLTNRGDSSSNTPSVITENYVIVDDEDNRYLPNDDDHSTIEVAAGETTPLEIVFDVPAEATGLGFIFKGGVVSREVEYPDLFPLSP